MSICLLEEKKNHDAECKWKDDPVQEDVLKTLIRRKNLFHFTDNYLYIFSKTDFSEDLKRAASSDSHIHLVDFGRMVQ